MNLFSRKLDSCDQSGSELSSDKWGHLSLPLHFHPSASPYPTIPPLPPWNNTADMPNTNQCPPLYFQARELLHLWSLHKSNGFICRAVTPAAQMAETTIVEKGPLVVNLSSALHCNWYASLHPSSLFPRPKSVTRSTWKAKCCLVWL